MPKLTLADYGNLQNETTVVAQLNANNALIEDALENTLSRDGTLPNEMNSPLDMNSKRILNLPAPVDPTEPVRIQDMSEFSAGATATTAIEGVVELATNTEATALSSTTHAITPSNLAAVLAVDVQTFTASGTWTKPAAGRFALVQLIAAGGGGSRRSVGNGAGGGCGPYYERLLPLSSLASTVAVTIGTGGAVQLTDNTNGNAGGTTSFGTHLVIYGGRGGEQAAAGVAATAGGSGSHYDLWTGGAANSTGLIAGFTTNANLATAVSQGFFGAAATGTVAGNTCQTVPVVAFQGGAGGSGHSSVGPASGVQNLSLSGGNGGVGNGAGAGGNGVSPGGGGGSGTTQGGSGGNGRIIVTVF